jgi:hypothetical protein
MALFKDRRGAGKNVELKGSSEPTAKQMIGTLGGFGMGPMAQGANSYAEKVAPIQKPAPYKKPRK